MTHVWDKLPGHPFSYGAFSVAVTYKHPFFKHKVTDISWHRLFFLNRNKQIPDLLIFHELLLRGFALLLIIKILSIFSPWYIVETLCNLGISQYFYEVGTTVIPVYQGRNLMLKKIHILSWVPRAWRSWDSNSLLSQPPGEKKERGEGQRNT